MNKPRQLDILYGTICVAGKAVKEYVPADPYEGPYQATPNLETQTLFTKNKGMTENVIINPIPSCYGLVTWNGFYLTVS